MVSHAGLPPGSANPQSSRGPKPEAQPLGGPYARYVLAILTLVYVFNFLDRQILSILAERIKQDLGLSDADLGFLYGTSFAVFYSLFGLALGRLADLWDRRRLIALALGLWSAMTMLSGLGRNFLHLTAARIGVAIGESGASPAAFSSLCDWFPRQQRTTVLAIYSGGVQIGVAISLLVGGQIVERWDVAFAPGSAPFGLRGWQVAFLVMGLPGLLLALVVRTLREPIRGQSDGIVGPTHPQPFRESARELASVLPLSALLRMHALGGDRRAIQVNLAAGVALAALAFGLTCWLGNPVQWVAWALGFYGLVSWAQNLRLRDPPCFALLWHGRALRMTILHLAVFSFPAYGIAFWTAPYFLRVLGQREGQAGIILGVTAALAGFGGTALGGVLADRLRRRHPAGRLYVGMIAAGLPVPIALALFTTADPTLAYLLNFLFVGSSQLIVGCAIASVQDLVLPRMRASAAAVYLLVVTLFGLALGPYAIGRTSLAFASLRIAILAALPLFLVSLLLALLASRHVGADEASLRDRARAAGEPT